MSNTRRATNDSVFHQSRYSSSSEFERGLIANLVAKRVSVIREKQDRELIWFLQLISHQEGGLRAVAGQLLEKYAGRIGTPAMVQIGKLANQDYNPDEVKKIRAELPEGLRGKFPLRGETELDLLKLRPRDYRNAKEAAFSRELLRMSGLPVSQNDLDAEDQERQIRNHPASYPVTGFQKICCDAAAAGEEGKMSALEKELYEICLDPARSIAVGQPWYFADLVSVLRDFHRERIEAQKTATVVTAIGGEIYSVLDYTVTARVLSLIQGMARTGKSFAARAWCEQNPGAARFVEVPPNNDDAGFFRALARGLGLGSFLKYKVCEIRERVESVLLSGDLVLVLDEAQRLWPQRDLRHCFPTRINWLMSMVNADVPICLVATPQFLEWQTAAQERGGWNSAQLVGRIGLYKPLPAELEIEDLIAVAKALLPEAGKDVLRALAAYARTSARYLAAIESITKRARYLAGRVGRERCSTEEVRTAMQESVIPSDTHLVQALEKGKAKKLPRRLVPAAINAAALAVPDVEDSPAPRRFNIPAGEPHLQT